MILKLVSFTERVGAGLILVVALLTACAALFRYLAVAQIPDWYPLACLLQGIAVFWGLAVTTQFQSHITVDILWSMLGSAGRRRLDFVANTVVCAFFAVFAWMVLLKVVGEMGSNLRTNELGLLLWPFHLVAALGIVMAFVLTVLMVLKSWHALVHGGERA